MPTEKAINAVFKSGLFCLKLDASKGLRTHFQQPQGASPSWKETRGTGGSSEEQSGVRVPLLLQPIKCSINVKCGKRPDFERKRAVDSLKCQQCVSVGNEHTGELLQSNCIIIFYQRNLMGFIEEKQIFSQAKNC